MNKLCLLCKKEFEVKRKNQGYCSEECKKKGNKIKHLKYIKENEEKLKQQAKNYRNKPEIKERIKEYKKVNGKKIKKYRKEYERLNLEKRSIQRKKWNENNKERLKILRKNNNKKLNLLRKTDKYLREQYLAEAKVRKYIVNHGNKLNLNIKCSICNDNKNIQFHHPDYSKPLEIVILCRKCHSRLHNKIINPDKLEIIDLNKKRFGL